MQNLMKCSIVLLLITYSVCLAIQDETTMEKNFVNPPDSAKPHTWWHWMNGNVTREGITADLEAMERVGIGGFQAFHIGKTPKGPVDYLSPIWLDMMKHTITEANRLGLEVCMQNCPGWSNSGGPWITPEYSMKKVVWTEKQVQGPLDFSEKLQQPETIKDYYRDIAVLAFPAPRTKIEGERFYIDDWKEKAGFERSYKKTQKHEESHIPDAEDIIAKSTILNISDKIDSDGQLHWQIPSGQWIIIRFGYTSTGSINLPAPDEAVGLECDKLSKAAAELHWANSVQKVIDLAGPLAGKTFNNVLIDSYEVGCQNWTLGFSEEFNKRTGYDLVKYMPCLTSRVVESSEVTERFLWDFRRVIADLFTENYFGHFAEMCHRNGMVLSVEPYGNGNFDDFAAAGKADIPMGEWWAQQKETSLHWSGKLASSAAHTYGRKYIGAEAFTSGPPTASAFTNYPAILKSQGDYFYCQGINRFIFHTFVHQPWLNVKPGMTMHRWGGQFNRNNTWFEQSSAWIKYLTRCQYLLQEGKFVADVCRWEGESVPAQAFVREVLDPAIPAGFDYDFCSTETLTQMTVENGMIKLPSGMSYRVLVLPTGPIRPEILQKVKSLADAGATIYGVKTTTSPSLKNYPACDVEVRGLAEQLWDSGKITSKPLADIFKSINILPDFEFTAEAIKTPTQFTSSGVEYIHRQIDGADVYFVSNQHQQSKQINAVFRVKDKQPELWHPDSGKTEEAPSYSFTNDGRTIVPLSLDPAGSVFVVFRKHTTVAKKADVKEELTSTEISGPWTLCFPQGWDAPKEIKLDTLIDWTKHENFDVQHFSGTATYLNTFKLSKKQLAKNESIFLDLGTVNVIAQVKLNGKDLGILWKPPFRVDISDAVKSGTNRLEVEVTNLWANRLIGDEKKYPDSFTTTSITVKNVKGWYVTELPEWLVKGTPQPQTGRKTFVPWLHYKGRADTPLFLSGMTGPVQLVFSQKIVLQ